MALAVIGASGRYYGLRVTVEARYAKCGFADNYRVTISGDEPTVSRFLADEAKRAEEKFNAAMNNISAQYSTVGGKR